MIENTHLRLGANSIASTPVTRDTPRKVPILQEILSKLLHRMILGEQKSKSLCLNRNFILSTGSAAFRAWALWIDVYPVWPVERCPIRRGISLAPPSTAFTINIIVIYHKCHQSCTWDRLHCADQSN